MHRWRNPLGHLHICRATHKRMVDRRNDNAVQHLGQLPSILVLQRGNVPIPLHAETRGRQHLLGGRHRRDLAAHGILGAKRDPRQRRASRSIRRRKDVCRVLSELLLDAGLLPRVARVGRNHRPDSTGGLDEVRWLFIFEREWELRDGT